MSYASETLVHYIETLWKQTNLNWNADNQAEVESIIESLESVIEESVQKKLCAEDRRQRIASEQLSALIVGNDVLWAKEPDACRSTEELVSGAVLLADLLLAELAKPKNS